MNEYITIEEELNSDDEWPICSKTEISDQTVISDTQFVPLRVGEVEPYESLYYTDMPYNSNNCYNIDEYIQFNDLDKTSNIFSEYIDTQEDFDVILNNFIKICTVVNDVE